MARLRSTVINKLRRTPEFCKKLAKALNVSEMTVRYNYRKNGDNNCLTKIDALHCIQELLDVKEIDQLLDRRSKGIPSFEDMCADANIVEIIPVKPEQSLDTKYEVVKVEQKSNDGGNERLFTFAPSNQNIRVETINGEPWFAAKDVCSCLGLGNSSQAISRLDNDEKGVITSDTLGGKQSLAAVNESGLYNLIFQSRKPEVKVFRKWVTSDVLPALRRTGAYQIKKRSHNTPVPAGSDIARLLLLIANNLQKGDRKAIAKQLGIARASVSNILSGKTKSNDILQVLYEKALENKQNGFINAYSREFVAAAITKLK